MGFIQPPPVNGGIIDNKGWEFSIGHRKEFGKQGYNIRLNYSYSKSKILYYAEPPYTGREWQATTGTEIGQQYGFQALGLFKNQAEIDNSPNQTSFFGSDVRPGDIKYRDLNGDNIINDQDKGYLPGTLASPRSILGLSLGYHYKGFDMSVLFQAGLGGSIMMQGGGIFPFSGFDWVLQDVVNDHWVASNPDADYQFPRMSSKTNFNNEQPSTFWIRSSDYLRLKTVELGYSVAPAWLKKKTGFSSARIFMNGINLFTWDHVKIFDPEIANGGTGTYPQQKVINTGLSFSF